MSESEKWSCSECGAPQVPQNQARVPCSQCGGSALHIELHFEDLVVVKAHDWLDAKMKNVTLPSKKKLRRHLQMGTQWSVGRANFVEKMRDVNKDTDSYFELVTDPSTGEVLRYCSEHLSEHVNRGSAKAKVEVQTARGPANAPDNGETV
jgi:hypothetical protein